MLLRLAGAILIICVLMTVVLTLPAGRQAVVLATTKQPEPFTELYFSNPNNLPKLITARVAARFSYEVVNHEAQTENYQADVTMVENGRSRSLGNAEFSLADEQSVTETVVFAAASAHETIELIVALPSQNETIHFWSQS